jgi:hypothetical protein
MAKVEVATIPAQAFAGTRSVLTPGELTSQQNTSAYRACWAVDDSYNEGAVSVPFVCPDGYTGSGTLKADIYFASGTQNSGTAVFGVYIEAITAGSDTLNVTTTDSFDSSSANLGTSDLSGSTTGDLLKQTISITAKDSIASGDHTRLIFYRNVATDSVSDDLYVYLVELYEDN